MFYMWNSWLIRNSHPVFLSVTLTFFLLDTCFTVHFFGNANTMRTCNTLPQNSDSIILPNDDNSSLRIDTSYYILIFYILLLFPFPRIQECGKTCIIRLYFTSRIAFFIFFSTYFTASNRHTVILPFFSRQFGPTIKVQRY